jgi:hypothetical protein
LAFPFIPASRNNNNAKNQPTMDYDAVRAAANGSTNMRRVEVNQRALIDKILARYATASAVYRELLQNSNDASATVRGLVVVSFVHSFLRLCWRFLYEPDQRQK